MENLSGSRKYERHEWSLNLTSQIKEWIDLSKDINALARLKDEAEKAKMQLSQSESVDITIPYICVWPDNQPRNLQESISKAQFEKMIDYIVDRTIWPVHQALKDAWKSPSDIDEVILVWWSTRIPLVQKKISDVFGKEAKATVNPDEAVALWASVQWGIIRWNVTDILLLDVTPLSLWVEVEWSMVDFVIPKNTTIPVKKSKVYTTAVNNQPAVTIHVVQWERTMASDNKSLGQFNLDWIPPAARWIPQIEVTFDMDANGMLHVSAKDKTTSKEQKVTIQWATNITDDEIQKMQDEAEKFADDDKKKKELIEAKNNYESLAYSLEKAVTEHKDKIEEEDKKKIEEYVADANKVKENPDITKEEIDKKHNELNTFATGFYQKIQQWAGFGWWQGPDFSWAAWPAPDAWATWPEWSENTWEGTVQWEVVEGEAEVIDADEKKEEESKEKPEEKDEKKDSKKDEKKD